MDSMVIKSDKPKIPAIFASVLLHAVIAAYILYSYNSSPVQVPAQQMITISLVSAEVVKEIKKPEPKEVVQTRPVVTERAVVKAPLPTPVKAPIQRMAEMEPKSGEVKNYAKKAADAVFTKPLFDAAYLNNPAPKYPESAKRRRQQGSVLLNVEVSRAGTAQQVQVHSSSGSSILDQAAVDAVLRWKFVPAKRDDEVVTAKVIVPIEFRLQ